GLSQVADSQSNTTRRSLQVFTFHGTKSPWDGPQASVEPRRPIAASCSAFWPSCFHSESKCDAAEIHFCSTSSNTDSEVLSHGAPSHSSCKNRVWRSKNWGIPFCPMSADSKRM